MSIDFKEPVRVSTSDRQWYQCFKCYADLRSGIHHPFCILEPEDRTSEVSRVSHVVSILFKSKGLTVISGGK